MANITIRDEFNVVADEPAAITAAVARCARFNNGRDLRFTIFTDSRKPDGWLEWLLVMDAGSNGHHVAGQSMTVALVQRTPSAGFEFHS